MYIADFSYDNPFIVARDVDMEIVSVVSEQQSRYPGVTVMPLSERQYDTAYARTSWGVQV